MTPVPKLCQSCFKNVAVALANKRYRCQTCINARRQETAKQEKRSWKTS